jgi:hypothetical protein
MPTFQPNRKAKEMINVKLSRASNKCTTLLNERLKIIAKYKYDMMILTIRTAEEVLRHHPEIIINEKKKLINAPVGQIPLPKRFVNVFNAIATPNPTGFIVRGRLIVNQNPKYNGSRNHSYH